MNLISQWPPSWSLYIWALYYTKMLQIYFFHSTLCNVHKHCFEKNISIISILLNAYNTASKTPKILKLAQKFTDTVKISLSYIILQFSSIFTGAAKLWRKPTLVVCSELSSAPPGKSVPGWITLASTVCSLVSFLADQYWSTENKATFYLKYKDSTHKTHVLKRWDIVLN